MSGATDRGMVKIMGIVISCLAVIAVLCVLAARLLSSGSDAYDDAMKRNALIQRIQPVAAVRTSADDLPAGDMQVAAADAPAKTGEELVGGACAACHIAGVAGAPKLDDDAAWAERREAGLDALVASVINGKGAMPARGGSDYSDDEIKLAVQQIAGFDVAEAPVVEASEAAEPATEESATAVPAAEPTAEVSQTDAPAAEPAAEASEADAPAAETSGTSASAAESTETEAPATEPAATEAEIVDTEALDEAEAEASQDTVTDESSAQAPSDTVVVGQVPDALTDNVKATVDGVCVACHIAGVAGAPKIGDTEAWQLRADKGMAALTSSVINGLNAMPARGGSALTDEEIPDAIQYLMSK